MVNDISKRILTELSPEHLLLLNLIINNPNAKDDWLAEQLKTSRTTIWNWRNRPHFKLALAEAFKPAKRIIEEAQPEAARVLRRKLKSNDEQVQVRAASQLLKPILEANQGNINILNQEGGQVLIKWANSQEEAQQLQAKQS
jgi:hypothetical protein